MNPNASFPPAADIAAFSRRRQRWLWMAFLPAVILPLALIAFMYVTSRMAPPSRVDPEASRVLYERMEFITGCVFLATVAWWLFCAWRITERREENQSAAGHAALTIGLALLLFILNIVASCVVAYAGCATIGVLSQKDWH